MRAVRGSEYVFAALRSEGIDAVFMVPGGLNDQFMPPMTSTPGVRTVVAAHEGGAAYMADGYARASGRFGVAFGIGGPGVLNMATALASARSDRTRVLAISGEVPTSLEGRGLFQDASGAGLDDLDILRPTAGRSLAVESPAMLDHHLKDAIAHMLARNEPAHVTIPTDVQSAEISGTWSTLPDRQYRPREIDVAALEGDVWPTLAGSSRVLAVAGAEVSGGDGAASLAAFAERYHVPVATTLSAKGVLPEDHPLSLGVFGYAGSRWATEAILDPRVEVLLVLGPDLNQRNTLYWEERMRPTRALIHVAADATLIGRVWPSLPVIGEPAAALAALAGAHGDAPERFVTSAPERRAFLDEVRARGDRCYAPEHEHADSTPIHPARMVAELRRAAPPGTVLAVDSGAHRAWAGHYWLSDGPGRYLTGANLGPMGAALPLAIGAWHARPDSPHAVVIGDGCMLMHGLELHTAVRHEVPLVVCVVNNGSYGNIWFRARAMGEGPSRLTDIPGIDWAAFANAMGARGRRVTEPGELGDAFGSAFASAASSRRPQLVDVHVDKTAEKPTTPWTQAMHDWEDHH